MAAARFITSGEKNELWGMAAVPTRLNSISVAPANPAERIKTAAMRAGIIFVFIFVSFVLMMPLLERRRVPRRQICL